MRKLENYLEFQNAIQINCQFEQPNKISHIDIAFQFTSFFASNNNKMQPRFALVKNKSDALIGKLKWLHSIFHSHSPFVCNQTDYFDIFSGEIKPNAPRIGSCRITDKILCSMLNIKGSS